MPSPRTTALLTLLFATLSFAAAPTTAPSPKLADKVAQNWARWDLNQDEELEPSELSAAVLDPAIRGDDAAAAAALFNYATQERKALRSLKITRAWATSSPEILSTKLTLNGVAPAPHHEDLDTPAATLEAGATPTTKPAAKPQVSPQSLFERSRRAIASAPSTLYTTGTPSFTKVRQGALGDCYLISMAGARAYTLPDTLQTMIKPLPTGGYTVNWADGISTEITPFTDGEKGAAGASMSGGLWVRVLEKALAFRKLPDDEEDETVASTVIVGGSARTITSLLTGHQTSGTPLFQGKAPTSDEIETKLVKLRTVLAEALPAKRMVSLSTSSTLTPPPGMSPKHAYAVLGFDAATDRITVWNPHANDFTPKGEEGLANGWPTKGGIFTLALKDCTQAFRSIGWELPTRLTKPITFAKPTTQPTLGAKPTTRVALR